MRKFLNYVQGLNKALLKSRQGAKELGAIGPVHCRLGDLRMMPWLSLLGTKYIKGAFSTELGADPKAFLVYKSASTIWCRTERRSAIWFLNCCNGSRNSESLCMPWDAGTPSR